MTLDLSDLRDCLPKLLFAQLLDDYKVGEGTRNYCLKRLVERIHKVSQDVPEDQTNQLKTSEIGCWIDRCFLYLDKFGAVGRFLLHR